MVETWIDTVAKVFEISDGRGGLVASYHSFDRADLPEALTDFPCALGYVTGCRPVISDNLSILFWDGITEFHIAPNTDKTNIPYLLPFFGRIIRAAAGSLRLGNMTGIEHFIIPPEDNAIQFVILTYGSEEPHHGIRVRWEVKENVSGVFTISG